MSRKTNFRQQGEKRLKRKAFTVSRFLFGFTTETHKKRRIEFANWQILIRLHFSARRFSAASRKTS
jgi:hypothetical protein